MATGNGGRIAAFFNRRRKKRSERLSSAAYSLIASRSNGYPYGCGEVELAYKLGIRPEKLPDILRPYTDDGRVKTSVVGNFNILRTLINPIICQSSQ